MRISSKGRYGLAVMVALAQKQKSISVIEVSKNLGISKIYLEQVFSLLKKADLITSVKGANGGYGLSRNANSISVYDMLKACESALFENTEKSCDNVEIEEIITSKVYSELDKKTKEFLESITLEELAESKDLNMFYI